MSKIFARYLTSFFGLLLLTSCLENTKPQAAAGTSTQGLGMAIINTGTNGPLDTIQSSTTDPFGVLVANFAETNLKKLESFASGLDIAQFGSSTYGYGFVRSSDNWAAGPAFPTRDAYASNDEFVAALNVAMAQVINASFNRIDAGLAADLNTLPAGSIVDMNESSTLSWLFQTGTAPPICRTNSDCITINTGADCGGQGAASTLLYGSTAVALADAYRSRATSFRNKIQDAGAYANRQMCPQIAFPDYEVEKAQCVASVCQVQLVDTRQPVAQ